MDRNEPGICGGSVVPWHCGSDVILNFNVKEYGSLNCIFHLLGFFFRVLDRFIFDVVCVWDHFMTELNEICVFH